MRYTPPGVGHRSGVLGRPPSAVPPERRVDVGWTPPSAGLPRARRGCRGRSTGTPSLEKADLIVRLLGATPTERFINRGHGRGRRRRA